VFTAKVAFDLSALDALQALVATMGQQVEQLVKREIRPFVSREVDVRLRVEPGPVKYPIQWTSLKQKRAFFATNGFGKGIPYQRTGKLVKGWQVRGDYRKGFGGITVSNPSPAAAFVQGYWQQGFHRNTGWTSAPDALQRISLEANEMLVQGWTQILILSHRGGRGRAR
jgi:hypothetical protein